jgi:hypothetical protein
MPWAAAGNSNCATVRKLKPDLALQQKNGRDALYQAAVDRDRAAY